MLQFAVTKKIITHSSYNISNKIEYGIEILEDGKVLKTFSSITFLEEKINRLTDLCNKFQISPVHFDDVLENFLADFESL